MRLCPSSVAAAKACPIISLDLDPLGLNLYIPLLSLPTVAAITVHSIIVCAKAVEAGYVRKQLMCIAVWEAERHQRRFRTASLRCTYLSVKTSQSEVSAKPMGISLQNARSA